MSKPNTPSAPAAPPTPQLTATAKFVANTTVDYKCPESGEEIKFKRGETVKGLSKKHAAALSKYLDEVSEK